MEILKSTPSLPPISLLAQILLIKDQTKLRGLLRKPPVPIVLSPDWLSTEVKNESYGQLRMQGFVINFGDNPAIFAA
jgi:hypothetical protein